MTKKNPQKTKQRNKSDNCNNFTNPTKGASTRQGCGTGGKCDGVWSLGMSAISLFHLPRVLCKIHSHKDCGVFAAVFWSHRPLPTGTRCSSSTTLSLQQPLSPVLPWALISLLLTSVLQDKLPHSGTQCPVSPQILSKRADSVLWEC